MTRPRCITAYTDPRQPEAPGHVVRFVNISEIGGGCVSISIRMGDGSMAGIELDGPTWAQVRRDIIDHGETAAPPVDS